MEEMEINVCIPPGLLINEIHAKIYAPDSSELGIFQPRDIKITDSNNISVFWRIENLKPMHSIQLIIHLYKRIIHIISLSNNGKQHLKVNCSNIDNSSSNKDQ